MWGDFSDFLIATYVFALLCTFLTIAFLEAFSQKGFGWIFQRKGVEIVKVTYSSPNLESPKVNELNVRQPKIVRSAHNFWLLLRGPNIASRHPNMHWRKGVNLYFWTCWKLSFFSEQWMYHIRVGMGFQPKLLISSLSITQ